MPFVRLSSFDAEGIPQNLKIYQQRQVSQSQSIYFLKLTELTKRRSATREWKTIWGEKFFFVNI